MAVVQLRFEPDATAARGAVFPDEIEDDPWIAFHGTTNAHEASIDSHGLAPTAVPVTKKEVAAVVAIFESLHWTGRSVGGLPILKPFSLHHDFAMADLKPIFLAETSLRATTFATRDFAGGETMRALRRAFDDHWAFRSSANLRAAHRRSLRAIVDRPATTGSDSVREFDASELDRRLLGLSVLRARCWKALENHSYGVVYALRFTSADATEFEYHPAMGLKVWSPISPAHIVAKIRIPSDWRPPQLHEGARRRHRRRLSETGLISQVRGSR